MDNDRRKDLEMLAEIDEKSIRLERTSEQIAEAIEAIRVVLDESTKREFQGYLAQSNKGRLAICGDCVQPITIPFFN